MRQVRAVKRRLRARTICDRNPGQLNNRLGFISNCIQMLSQNFIENYSLSCTWRDRIYVTYVLTISVFCFRRWFSQFAHLHGRNSRRGTSCVTKKKPCYETRAERSNRCVSLIVSVARMRGESLRGVIWVGGWISITSLAGVSAIRIVAMIDSAVIKCFREVEHIVRREDYAAHAFPRTLTWFTLSTRTNVCAGREMKYKAIEREREREASVYYELIAN